MKFEKPKLRLGYAPTRRDMFLHPMFKERKTAIDAKVRELAQVCDVDLVTTEDLPFADKSYSMGGRTIQVAADELMTDYADAQLISERFRAQKVDALFVPFCNFGQEEAVARLAKDLDVPLLVWAPRDPRADRVGSAADGQPVRHLCGDQGAGTLRRDVYLHRKLPFGGRRLP